MLLEYAQTKSIYGKGAIAYIAIAGGIIAVVRLLFSRRGRIKVPGLHISWD
ncbi:MAG: hypothetical protein WBO70_05185 [Erysipelotrichaceae bacterium]